LSFGFGYPVLNIKVHVVIALGTPRGIVTKTPLTQLYGCSTPLQRQAKLPLRSNVQIPLLLSHDGHKSLDGPKPEFPHAHSNVFNSLSFLIVVTPAAITGILTTDLLPSNSEISPTSFVKSSF
jgi:hypothetical protein